MFIKLLCYCWIQSIYFSHKRRIKLDTCRCRTIQYLNRIEYISMRENRGSEIVKELTGRDAPTILDPVFFLSKNEWLERIPNKREINEPYIFAYFLGATQEYRNLE